MCVKTVLFYFLKKLHRCFGKESNIANSSPEVMLNDTEELGNGGWGEVS